MDPSDADISSKQSVCVAPNGNEKNKEMVTPVGTTEETSEVEKAESAEVEIVNEFIERAEVADDEDKENKPPVEQSEYPEQQVSEVEADKPSSIKAEDVSFERPVSSNTLNSDSDYDEIESFVSTYEEIEDVKDVEITEPNASEQNEPTTPPSNDCMMSSTPHVSPIKSINENNCETSTPTKHKSVIFASLDKLDLNRRSNKSYVSYDSTKSKQHVSDMSTNSIFSDAKRNQLVMVHEEHSVNEGDKLVLRADLDRAKQKLIQQDQDYESSIKLVESSDFAIPYPGVDGDAIAELAAISDDSFQSDPINAALLKLEGTYTINKGSNRSIDSKELQRQVDDLDIKSARNSITNEVLSIGNNANHISFILNFDSKTLAQQFTLVEKDCLLEIDWKELIELKWNFNNIVSINSWLELLIQNETIKGIDLCISRFNLTVNWIISEILLTKDITLRKLTIQRFIHIAQNCMMLQNYSTLMEILLALGSDKILKLKNTWRIIEPGDILIYKNLEKISSPFKNFANLRNELNNLKPSKGCVPFLGLHLSDLIFNKEKNSTKNDLINFNKFRTDSKIVKSLIQCIQWSTLYRLDSVDEVLSKCLYIKALDEEEMNECLKDIEGTV
ncbi:unnamed protein product [Wickerhamomyces anomalus]